MNEHLPECFALMCKCDETHFKSIDCDLCCICDRLRACESRIRSGYADTYTEGIAAGLDAVREAIESLPVAISSYYPDDSLRDVGFWRSSALAAIDALREKR